MISAFFLYNFGFSGLANWQTHTCISVGKIKENKRKMSLLSRFFYKRPPDGLLEFVERVYGNILFSFFNLVLLFFLWHCVLLG